MRRVLAAASAAALVVGIFAGPTLAGRGGFSPITATGHAIQDDIGSCNNVWATDSLYKAYKLTLVTAGVYNLEVNEGGPFTTIAGKSPGACEKTGAYNGETVAAGVRGLDYQKFNQTVTSAATPNQHPNCAANNSCAGSGDFLTAVFGSGPLTRGAWSFTALYVTRANGIWFDTSVNWPLNDRGDITGS